MTKRNDKKSRIRETPTLSTNADCRTNTNLKRLRDLSKKKKNPFFWRVFFNEKLCSFIGDPLCQKNVWPKSYIWHIWHFQPKRCTCQYNLHQKRYISMSIYFLSWEIFLSISSCIFDIFEACIYLYTNVLIWLKQTIHLFFSLCINMHWLVMNSVTGFEGKTEKYGKSQFSKEILIKYY